MIETEHLILRYLQDDDLESVFYNYANDDEVTKYLTWPTHKTIEDTKRIFNVWKKQDELIQKYHYFIVLKETNELIGSIDAVFDNNIPEIGMVIGRNWWNKGYITEALKKMIEILFSDGYNKIAIKAMKENGASNHVINKCGFKFVKEEEFTLALKDNKTVICNVYELYNN